MTALARRKVGEVIDDPDGLALIRALMREIIAVANAEGVALGEAQIEAADQAIAEASARGAHLHLAGFAARQAARI